jgi:hypothetical protein
VGETQTIAPTAHLVQAARSETPRTPRSMSNSFATSSMGLRLRLLLFGPLPATCEAPTGF